VNEEQYSIGMLPQAAKQIESNGLLAAPMFARAGLLDELEIRQLPFAQNHIVRREISCHVRGTVDFSIHSLFDRFVRQTDIILGNRRAPRQRAREIVEFGLLNALAERIVIEFV